MKINNLVLNSVTRSQLEAYLQRPTHALLLTGLPGVGLATIAQALAGHIAGPEVITIQPIPHSKNAKPTINIEEIRSINSMVGHRRTDKLVIIIDEIGTMTEKAPEAFLKLLEEPSPEVYYIMTTHDSTGIKDTILSRSQIVSVLPASHDDCKALFDRSSLRLTDDKRKKIDFIAGGYPAEIIRLVTDEAYFRVKAESIEKAKLFLTGKMMDRLEIVSGISGREQAAELARNLAKLMTITAGQAQHAKQLPARLKTISAVLDNLKQNGNVRAQLLFLALNI